MFLLSKNFYKRTLFQLYFPQLKSSKIVCIFNGFDAQTKTFKNRSVNSNNTLNANFPIIVV